MYICILKIIWQNIHENLVFLYNYIKGDFFLFFFLGFKNVLQNNNKENKILRNLFAPEYTVTLAE